MTDRTAAVVAGAGLCLVMLVAARVTRVDGAEPAAVHVEFDEDINDGGAALRQLAQVSGDWIGSLNGLALNPAGQGAVTFDLVRVPGVSLRMQIWLYRPAGVSTSLECGDSDGSVRILAADRSLAGTMVPLDNCPAAGGRTRIRISARADGDPTAATALVLDKILIHGHRGLWTPPALLPWLMAVASSALGWRMGRTRAHSVIAATLIGAAAWWLAGTRWLDIGLHVPGTPQPLPIAWVLIGVIAAGFLLFDRRRPPATATLGVLWLLGAAALLRWDALGMAVFRPLDPDAATVVKLAERMTSPFDTGVREPLWVWAVWILRKVVGQPEVAVRMFSLSSAVALLVATWILIRLRFASGTIAILAVALLARHPFLIDSSTRGLRTELSAALIVLFTCLATSPRIRESGRVIGLAIGSTLLALTQLSSVPVVLVLLGYAWRRHHLSWRGPALAVAVMIAAITPHLVNNARVHGDPLFSLNAHATWYRNHEFVAVKKTGCEGCPSPAVHAVDSYAGAPTTMGKYVFGMHDSREIVSRMWMGLRGLFLSRDTPATTVLGFSTPALFLSYAVGLAILLWKRPEFVLVPLMSVNLLLFIIPIGLDPRLLMNCAPFLAAATAVPLAMAAEAIRTRRVSAAWQVVASVA